MSYTPKKHSWLSGPVRVAPEPREVQVQAERADARRLFSDPKPFPNMLQMTADAIDYLANLVAEAEVKGRTYSPKANGYIYDLTAVRAERLRIVAEHLEKQQQANGQRAAQLARELEIAKREIEILRRTVVGRRRVIDQLEKELETATDLADHATKAMARKDAELETAKRAVKSLLKAFNEDEQIEVVFQYTTNVGGTSPDAAADIALALTANKVGGRA